MNIQDYIEDVYKYMEYIGVPELVVYYRPEDVANAFNPMIITSYQIDVSPRMCAIVLWCMAIKKVQEQSSKETKQ